jgi:radical SAM superfamily enzyme YgiQ (UPF0313 family)
MGSDVLLFQVPTTIEVVSGIPFSVNQTPISLGYIAASLRSAGKRVRIVDLLYPEIPSTTVGRPSSLAIKHIIERENPKVVGFSVYNSNMDEVLGIARVCKEVNRDILTIIGGPQATFMPEESLNDMPSVDIIARGEGEHLMLEVLEAVEGKRELRDISGITYRSGDTIVSTEARGLIQDLDALPSPYVEGVFEMDNYAIATLLSSRGCVHRCSFCYTPRAFGRRLRFHSKEYVLRDVEIACSKGVEMLWFADPNFAASRKHVSGILEGIAEGGYDVPIWCQTRVDDVDREILQLMKKAGVEWIFFGLESGRQEALDSMHKGIKLAQVERAVRAAREVGIKVELSVIIGLPGETKEEAKDTLRFAKSLGADRIAVNRLRLYFGTEICERKGWYRLLRPLPSYKSPGYSYESYSLSNAEIEELIKEEGLADDFFSKYTAYGESEIDKVTVVIPETGQPVAGVSRSLLCFY